MHFFYRKLVMHFFIETCNAFFIENVSGYSRNPCSLNRERDAAWAFHALGTPPGVLIVWSPYRITPIHRLMARHRPWRTHVISLYWRTRHLLLRFLCRKEPCRQREELGSKHSVLYHRFTYAAWPFHALGTIYQTRQAKNAALSGPKTNQTAYGWFKQTEPENPEPYQYQGCRTWQKCAERTILPLHKYPPEEPLWKELERRLRP